MLPKSTLIGLGNILMRDEGVGVHAVAHIRANYIVSPELEIVDGGTSGLDLLPFIEERDQVLFVDAINFKREPGYIGVLTGDQIPALAGVKDCLHHTGLTDVLAAARLLDRFPGRIVLIGIQPHTIATGLDLSDTIGSRFEALMDQVINQLATWGLRLIPDRPLQNYA